MNKNCINYWNPAAKASKIPLSPPFLLASYVLLIYFTLFNFILCILDLSFPDKCSRDK